MHLSWLGLGPALFTTLRLFSVAIKTGGRGNREPGRVGAGQTALSLEAGPEPSAKELASDVSLWPDTLLPGLARPPHARTQCYFLRDPCSPDGYRNRSCTLLSWSSQALAQTEGWGSCSQACVPHPLSMVCKFSVKQGPQALTRAQRESAF